MPRLSTTPYRLHLTLFRAALLFGSLFQLGFSLTFLLVCVKQHKYFMAHPPNPSKTPMELLSRIVD